MDEVSSHVRLDPPFVRWQGRGKDCSTPSSTPIMEGPGADSEEKHEPASDIDTVVVDSLKALDPKRPIREADIIREIDNAKALKCCAAIPESELDAQEFADRSSRSRCINLRNRVRQGVT